MATIADSDFNWIKEFVKSNPVIYRELASWGIQRSVFKAAFQAVEDMMVSAFSTTPTSSIRATIESVTGATTTIRAQYIFAVWAGLATIRPLLFYLDVNMLKYLCRFPYNPIG